MVGYKNYVDKLILSFLGKLTRLSFERWQLKLLNRNVANTKYPNIIKEKQLILLFRYVFQHVNYHLTIYTTIICLYLVCQCIIYYNAFKILYLIGVHDNKILSNKTMMKMKSNRCTKAISLGNIFRNFL